MGICPMRNFCKFKEQFEKEGEDHVNFFCHSSAYEECHYWERAVEEA